MTANMFTDSDTVQLMTSLPVIEGKQYLEDQNLAKIATSILIEKELQTGKAEIGYLLVYPNIAKLTAAKCVKSSPLVKHYSGRDFFIMISGELWDMIIDDTETVNALLWHQLMHIEARYNEKAREWKYSIRQHDYSDFYEILKSEGARWCQVVQSVMSSLYDLDLKQESKVKV